jgi:hypothetical protein
MTARFRCSFSTLIRYERLADRELGQLEAKSGRMLQTVGQGSLEAGSAGNDGWQAEVESRTAATTGGHAGRESETARRRSPDGTRRARRIDSEQIWGTAVSPVGGVQQNDARSALRAQHASASRRGGWVVVNPCAIRGMVERA